MQVRAVIQKCFRFRNSVQLDIYCYKSKLNQFKQDTKKFMSTSTFQLWLQRPNFPTQHATYQNFHRAGSQETCQGNGEHSEWFKEEKWRWHPRARLCMQLSPATSWARQLQHPSSLTSSHGQGSGLHRDLTPQPQHCCRATAACSTHARSQLLASHNLASLGFVLGDYFFFFLHQGESFE